MAANEAAKEDVFIDSEGNRVSGSDPKAAFKIASKGVVPDAKIAARYKDAFSASAPKESADEKADVTKSDAASRKTSGAKKTS